MCFSANVVSPFQGFVGVVDVSTVRCTDGYFCNAPSSVLYYGIFIKPQSGDTTITTCEAGGNGITHTPKPRSGDTINGEVFTQILINYRNKN